MIGWTRPDLADTDTRQPEAFGDLRHRKPIRNRAISNSRVAQGGRVRLRCASAERAVGATEIFGLTKSSPVVRARPAVTAHSSWSATRAPRPQGCAQHRGLVVNLEHQNSGSGGTSHCAPQCFGPAQVGERNVHHRYAGVTRPRRGAFHFVPGRRTATRRPPCRTPRTTRRTSSTSSPARVSVSRPSNQLSTPARRRST
jgi:hypothetical protein